ncbi:gliding motility-associated peptidyl-prolyl isomerase GldI [Flavobacteriaceae bacterium TK19130]|nr:gliding motility-associated peptidyl-prolyl isomerase GldI [Thermobacterium salinum]
MRNNLILFILFTTTILFSCKGPEARRPVQQSSGSFIQESAQRNKALYEQEKQQIEGLINSDTLQEYITSDSGFWYYYNVKDTTAVETPDFGDRVVFSYNIKDLSGNVVLTKEEAGLQEYRIDQTNQDLISGLRDGIKLMKEGETVTFLFPSYKAYGYYGLENKLGTNVPVQSTVTLQTIEKTTEN